MIPYPRWEDFLDLSLEEIRFYGGNNVQVMRRMKALISDLISALPHERHKPLLQFQQRLDAGIGKAFGTQKTGSRLLSKTGKGWVIRGDTLSLLQHSRRRSPTEQQPIEARPHISDRQ